MIVHHIINDVNPANGGAERLVPMLHAGLRDAGIDSRIVSLSDTEDYGLDSITLLGLASPYEFKTVPRLRRYMKENCGTDDIVHAHLFPAMLFTTIAKMLSRWRGKMVFTEHSTRNRRRGTIRGRLIDAIGYSGYERIACISNGSRDALVKWRSALADSLTVVENGAELHFTQHQERSDKQPLKVLSVGRLEEPKNYEMALRAVAAITKPEFTYSIAGDGTLMTKLRQLSEDLGISDRVAFHGYVPDIRPMLAEADMLLMPSQWEGFGLSAVEAMNASLPVVAGDVDGLREVVGADGKCGALVDPQDHESIAAGLRSLLGDAELRRQCGKAAFVRSLQFTSGRMVEKYIHLYESLAEND